MDANGSVIGKVTGERVTWGVHLANTKANWNGFNNPLDNGDLAPGLRSTKRNQYFVAYQDREENLIIDGSALEISGVETNAIGSDAACKFTDKYPVWRSETLTQRNAIAQVKGVAKVLDRSAF